MKSLACLLWCKYPFRGTHLFLLGRQPRQVRGQQDEQPAGALRHQVPVLLDRQFAQFGEDAAPRDDLGVEGARLHVYERVPAACNIHGGFEWNRSPCRQWDNARENQVSFIMCGLSNAANSSPAHLSDHLDLGSR